MNLLPYLSIVPGKIPTVNQLEKALLTLGYNIADAKLYGLKIVGGVKTVELLLGGGSSSHDRLHAMDSAADHAAVSAQYKGMIPQADPGTGEWKLVPMPGGSGQTEFTKLISGNVIWISGLDFFVTDCVYIIAGINYSSSAITITLDDADNTYTRIDVIYVDVNGSVGVLTGTPAANPSKPIIDNLTQLELTQVIIEANATGPSNIITIQVYDENTEWTTVSSIPDPLTSSVDFESTVDPAQNTKCIKVEKTGITGIERVHLFFTSVTPVVITPDASIIMQICSSSAFPVSAGITICLKRNGIQVGTQTGIDGFNYGFISTLAGWQTLIISAANFNITYPQAVDEIELAFNTIPWGNIGFNVRFDDIKIQTGISVIYNDAITRIVELKVVSDLMNPLTGDGKIIFCIPLEMDGMKLNAAHAFVTTAATGDTLIQIRNISLSADMLTTRIKIDSTHYTSYSSTIQPEIDITNASVKTGDLIAVDVDSVAAASKGLGVILTFKN